MNSTVKTVVFWLVIVLSAFLLWQVVKAGSAGQKDKEVNFSQFLTDVDQGNVKEVTITGQEVRGKYRNDNSAFHTTAPSNYPDMIKTLRDKGVTMNIRDITSGSWPLQLLGTWAPLILLAALWFFMMRQMQTGGNKALSFGKSRARLLSMQQKKVTFKDVAGVDEAKEELQEIIEFLREAQKFQKLGGRIPKGVLLVGPPGTGKTLLARAVAGEANVPFFSISGSDFVEMFVGVGASRVRDLFEQGKKNAPCIIFIDEIDAVGRHRGAGLGGGHDEREQTLNQLLVEMDGFESNEGVILMAATNRPDVLDPALLRPGRFDRRVVVSRPDVRGREEILRVHTRKIPLADDVDLSVLARGTPGFSGADLANLVNEAALAAARQNRKAVLMYDFELAKDKVLMGVERKSHAALRRGEEEHGLSRSRTRAGGGDAAACRSAAQSHHHSARNGAGRHHAVADRRQAQLLPRNYLETADRHPDGRPHRGRDVPEPDDHRRRQRHRARHRTGPQDGLRVGHERSGSADLRQEGRADLPGPRDRAASRLQRSHGDQDRRGSAEAGRATATTRPRTFCPTTATCWIRIAHGADRARSAGRSADQDDHRRPGTAEDRSSAEGGRRRAAGDQARPAAGTGQGRGTAGASVERASDLGLQQNIGAAKCRPLFFGTVTCGSRPRGGCGWTLEFFETVMAITSVFGASTGARFQHFADFDGWYAVPLSDPG